MDYYLLMVMTFSSLAYLFCCLIELKLSTKRIIFGCIIIWPISIVIAVIIAIFVAVEFVLKICAETLVSRK